MNNKNYTQLFSLNKQKKLITFEIVCNDYSKGIYTTRTGTFDGKKVVKEHKIKSNSRYNIEERVETAIKKEIENKQNSGYKSVEQLQSVFGDKVYDSNFILQCLKSLNYVSNINFEPLPMLANKVKSLKKNKSYIFQPKLNGVRMLFSFKDLKGISRGGYYYEIPKHLKDELIYIKDYLLTEKQKDNLFFDGELFIKDVPLQTISGLARRKKGVGSELKLEYWIYDSFDKSNIGKKQLERIKSIRLNNKLQYVKVVKSIISNSDLLKSFHSKAISEGFEGTIVRDAEGIYESSFRSDYLLKYKDFQEEEFEIIDVVYDENEGEPRYCVYLVKDNNNRIFKVTPKLTLPEREKLYYDRKNYVGKMLTVVYFEKSVNGIPTMANGIHVRPKGE